MIKILLAIVLGAVMIALGFFAGLTCGKIHENSNN